jgi:hypothetical protein
MQGPLEPEPSGEGEPLAAGACVHLRGLRSEGAQALNGKRGTVLGPQAGGTGRLKVRMDTATKLLSGSHFARSVLARDANLGGARGPPGPLGLAIA